MILLNFFVFDDNIYANMNMSQHSRLDSIRILRSVGGCTLNDHKTNHDIREALNVYNSNKIVIYYRCK